MLGVAWWARRGVLGVCGILYATAPGCSSGAFKDCPAGQETCSCYGNLSCDAGLSCFSNVCVRATSTGGAGGGAGERNSGGAGSPRGGTTSSDGGSSLSGGDDAGGAGPGAEGGAASESGGMQGSGGAAPGKGGAPGAGGATPSKGGTSGLGGSSGGSADAGSAGSAEGGNGAGGGSGEMPTVLILLDSSSSMFEGADAGATSWAYTRSALMDTPGGAITAYADRVRFGFASFKGNAASTTETNLACAEMTNVAFGVDNSAAIDQTYDELTSQWTGKEKWETPTGHALTRATAMLLGDPAPGGKYLLLLTDGNPNTCKTLDPQCGQDRSVFAAQEAFRAGIKTYAVGVGLITQSNTIASGCSDTMARCGMNHLADLANAGQGKPVQQPPEGYVYSACVMYETQSYVASYSLTGGTSQAWAGTTPAEIRVALGSALDAILADAR